MASNPRPRCGRQAFRDLHRPHLASDLTSVLPVHPGPASVTPGTLPPRGYCTGCSLQRNAIPSPPMSTRLVSSLLCSAQCQPYSEPSLITLFKTAANPLPSTPKPSFWIYSFPIGRRMEEDTSLPLLYIRHTPSSDTFPSLFIIIRM